MRVLAALLIPALAPLMLACTTFPEPEVSEAEFDSKTPYPKLVPLEELLKEPEPSITDELQSDLTTRRDDLLSAPGSSNAAASQDPVLDRIDALRAQRDEQAARDSIIDDALRKRMEAGITAPTVPE